MICTIHLQSLTDEWFVVELPRFYDESFADFLEQMQKFGRQHCTELFPYVLVTIDSGDIRRMVGRYWWSNYGVMSDEKTISYYS